MMKKREPTMENDEEETKTMTNYEKQRNTNET